MKKRIALMIISILILCALCAPALAVGDSSDILGMWYLIRMEEVGVSVNPASFDFEVTLELFDTGRYELWMSGGEGQTGTWAYAEGLFTIEPSD